MSWREPTITTKPVFTCGHTCTWPSEVWKPNPTGKLYCGTCAQTHFIREFPRGDQLTVWEILTPEMSLW